MVYWVYLYRENPTLLYFGKNYVRCFQDTALFEQIFYRILKEAIIKGLVNPDVAFIDLTHVKANTNKKQFEKKVARVETRSYPVQLDEEINIDHEGHRKKSFPHRIGKR